MTHALILQDLLKDNDIFWQLHNCKLINTTFVFDAPLPLYVHYNNLSDEQKDAHPLGFELLKRLNEPMTIAEVAGLTGIDQASFKKAWQIKYIASVVVFCENLQLALRFHISNTAKPVQAVFVADQDKAWANECERWQAFGMVDVLYKGTHALYSHTQEDELPISTLLHYQALPSLHSLSVLELINQKNSHLQGVDTAIQERLLMIL